MRAGAKDAVHVEVARRVQSACEEYQEWERVLEFKEAQSASAVSRDARRWLVSESCAKYARLRRSIGELNARTDFSLGAYCLILF